MTQMVALEELHPELSSRVMAATAHAEWRMIRRRSPGPTSSETEYAVYAITGDRLVCMVLALREDGSVAEATRSIRRSLPAPQGT